MAAISNLYIDQGTDYSTVVIVSTPSGDPFNLTGFSAKSQIRKSYSSSKFHSFTSSILNAEEGKIRLTFSAEETSAIQPGRWLFDVEITQDSTGKKRRVVEGIVIVSPQITQI